MGMQEGDNGHPVPTPGEQKPSEHLTAVKPATALPWSVTADGLIQDANGTPIARMGAASLMPRSVVDRDERMAYIVHACNAYPRLVGALRDLLSRSDQLIFRPEVDDSRKIDADTRNLRECLTLLRELGEL